MGISVLMSIYKKEKPEYFRETMESILAQTRQPEEIVLIEDGTLTPELDAVIEEYQKRCSNLKVYPHKENQMLGRALAEGVTLCSYELIARMDTDDVMMPKRLEQQYAYMQQHPEISVCGGFIREFNDEGTYERIKRMPRLMEDILPYARYRNPLNHMTVMFRKQDVLNAGNYRHFPYLEDYDLWSRMLAKGCAFYNLPEILVKARTSEALYERRGGAAYFRQYKQLRKEQHTLGLTSGKEYATGCILSFGMTMQPSFLRKLTYQKVLRK